MSLPRFGVQHPVPVNLLMAALLIGGVACTFVLRREFFPETTPEAALVSLPYPGASPEEIEETLAIKVEDALFNLDEVEKLTTTISENGGGINVEFRESVNDIPKAVDEIERAIDSLQDLPEEAERIEVREFEPTLPVIMVSIFGDADEATLKHTIRSIRDELRTLSDMGDVSISGVRDYEVRIDVEQHHLLEHGIGLPQVADAVSRWMSDIPGGTVRTATGNINVRTLGVEENADAIRGIVVRATPDGQVLRVGDIATVRETFEDAQFRTRFSTREVSGRSASLTVLKMGDQDIVKMADLVSAYVRGRAGEPFQMTVGDRILQVLENLMRARDPSAELKSVRREAYDLGATSHVPLPPGVDIATHSNLARFVRGRLELLTRNALQGAALVFLTLLLFLNWRVAFWVGVGLTTALAGTLIVMYAADVTLNLLTMFGLIVVLGILVDDAIVVAENVQARHDRGEPSLNAAVRGAEQVGWPVVATVLTTIVAFLPLTFISGTIGDLMAALPMVVACALMMSLVESLLILPSHMGHSLVHRDKARNRPTKHRRFWLPLDRLEQKRDDFILKKIVPAYARLLKLSLEYRYVSLAIAVATLICFIGLVTGGRVHYVFLPSEDSESFIVELRMPVGVAIEETDALAGRIERAAMAQPEVKTISAIIGHHVNVDGGGIGAGASEATHLAQIFIELTDVESRDRTSGEVIDSMRDELGPLTEVDRLSFSEISGGPGGADISLLVRGDNEEYLLALADDVKAALSEFEGVHDIYDDYSVGQREIQFSIKPGGAALGFTQADVSRQIRGALYGIEAHVFSAEQEDIKVRVRLDEATRRNLYAIENLWVVSPAGRIVPLTEIADRTEGTGYATITRVDRQRALTVTAEVAQGGSPEEIVREIDFNALAAKYPGATIEPAGRQEQQMKAFATLPYGFAAALIMIYVILAWLFSSYTQPIAVMLAIPFGIIGVIAGHMILGFDLTFLSMIGFVALSGIVVNDSLILVQFYNGLRAEGATLREGLIEAGKQRLRPIFLTTVTTILGLTPLMLEQSFQARFLIPMAISISFGLMSATVLILMVLPCILVIVDDVKRASYFLWHGLPRPEYKADAQPAFDLPDE